jgi:hypothetical protein
MVLRCVSDILHFNVANINRDLSGRYLQQDMGAQVNKIFNAFLRVQVTLLVRGFELIRGTFTVVIFVPRSLGVSLIRGRSCAGAWRSLPSPKLPPFSSLWILCPSITLITFWPEMPTSS